MCVLYSFYLLINTNLSKSFFVFIFFSFYFHFVFLFTRYVAAFQNKIILTILFNGLNLLSLKIYGLNCSLLQTNQEYLKTIKQVLEIWIGVCPMCLGFYMYNTLNSKKLTIHRIFVDFIINNKKLSNQFLLIYNMSIE